MTRLAARAVRDFVAGTPGSPTYAALLAGVAVEAAVVPGLAALGAVVGPTVAASTATSTAATVGAMLAVGVATLAGGLVVGYAVGDGRATDALGHPGTYAYAVLPLLARWLVLLALLDRLAPAGSVLLGDTTYLAGVVTPVAIVACTGGAALSPTPSTSDPDRRSRR
ncbi:hypothetical protein [Halorubellus sp. PRR65]|uniref:hypothetical protein n=1 Tax=Halorubellus sp. PRR65 TaxID=3098148 RepID=UPI002B25ECA5|nr:hypothetical protein [Halorubellus sp. PRR65]